MKVKDDHRSKVSNLSNWKEEACDDYPAMITLFLGAGN